MAESGEFDRQVQSIERLVRALESSPDSAASANARELMQAVMGLHGACLERILEIVRKNGGQEIIDAFAADERVRSLLLLYDLHPQGIEARVRRALETAQPALRSHGGEVDLVGVDDAGVVTVRLKSGCNSCASSSSTLQSIVEQAICDSAPDASAISFENSGPASALAFVPLTSLGTYSGSAPVEIPLLQRSGK